MVVYNILEAQQVLVFLISIFLLTKCPEERFSVWKKNTFLVLFIIQARNQTKISRSPHRNNQYKSRNNQIFVEVFTF